MNINIIFVVVVLLTSSYICLCVFPSSFAPTLYIGNGQAGLAGFVTDINADTLPDIVLSYYQRDYGILSTTIYLNNGCSLERHISPAQVVSYCPQYLDQVRLLAWEANPPVVKINLQNTTISQYIQLPYREFEFISLIKIRYGYNVIPNFKRGMNDIDYHAISSGDEISVPVQ
ncbi:hypothetical protein ABK040_006394 [Willaertia magna]